jgi:heat-inducible transcriptional repressor
VIDDSDGGDQRELDRIASELNQRVVGRTLDEVRQLLCREIIELRSEVGRVFARVLRLGLRVMEAQILDPADLVIATRLALFEQPEFSDPERLREIFATVETNERLLEILGDVVDTEGVSVVLGEDLNDPGLCHCALVAAPYGGDLGALGVIGPSRMDYGRIIPLVSYCSQLVTQKLVA